MESNRAVKRGIEFESESKVKIMTGFILIMITILSTVVGIVLNKQFERNYYEQAIDVPWCVLQSIFLFCALMTVPNPDVTGWFILWCVVTVIAYGCGLSTCKQHAIAIEAKPEDVKKAMFAQFILPIGAALVLIIIVVLISSGSKKKKK